MEYKVSEEVKQEIFALLGVFSGKAKIEMTLAEAAKISQGMQRVQAAFSEKKENASEAVAEG